MSRGQRHFLARVHISHGHCFSGAHPRVCLLLQAAWTQRWRQHRLRPDDFRVLAAAVTLNMECSVHLVVAKSLADVAEIGRGLREGWLTVCVLSKRDDGRPCEQTPVPHSSLLAGSDWEVAVVVGLDLGVAGRGPSALRPCPMLMVMARARSCCRSSGLSALSLWRHV